MGCGSSSPHAVDDSLPLPANTSSTSAPRAAAAPLVSAAPAPDLSRHSSAGGLRPLSIRPTHADGLSDLKRTGSGQNLLAALGGSHHHPHQRALPELPSAITLAAAFNDVAYFKSMLALLEAKLAKEAAARVHHDAHHSSSTAHEPLLLARQTSEPRAHGGAAQPRIRELRSGTVPVHDPTSSHPADASAGSSGSAAHAIGDPSKGAPSAFAAVAKDAPPAASAPAAQERGQDERDATAADPTNTAPSPTPLPSPSPPLSVGGEGGSGSAASSATASNGVDVSALPLPLGGPQELTPKASLDFAAASSGLAASPQQDEGSSEEPSGAHSPASNAAPVSPAYATASAPVTAGGSSAPLVSPSSASGSGEGFSGASPSPAQLPHPPAALVGGAVGAPAASPDASGLARPLSGSPVGLSVVSRSLTTGHAPGAGAHGGASLSVRTLATYPDKRVHGETVLQIAVAAGSADVVALFLAADPTLTALQRTGTGNTLLHYAALGPPHVADVFKSVRAHLLHNPDLTPFRNTSGIAPSPGGGSSGDNTPVNGGEAGGQSGRAMNGRDTPVLAAAARQQQPSLGGGGGGPPQLSGQAPGGSGPVGAHPRSLTLHHPVPFEGGGGATPVGGATPLPSPGGLAGAPASASASGSSGVGGGGAFRVTGLEYLRSLLKVQAESGEGAAAPRHSDAAFNGSKRSNSSSNLLGLVRSNSSSALLSLPGMGGGSNGDSSGDLVMRAAANRLASHGHLADTAAATAASAAGGEHAPPAPASSSKAAIAALFADLKARFPPRSVSRTVAVLVAAHAPCGRLNAFGRTPRDIAAAYTHQIMPEACVAASSGASLISESSLWDRLLHNVHSDWEAVRELLDKAAAQGGSGGATAAPLVAISAVSPRR